MKRKISILTRAWQSRQTQLMKNVTEDELIKNVDENQMKKNIDEDQLMDKQR